MFLNHQINSIYYEKAFHEIKYGTVKLKSFRVKLTKYPPFLVIMTLKGSHITPA